MIDLRVVGLSFAIICFVFYFSVLILLCLLACRVVYTSHAVGNEELTIPKFGDI